MEEKKITISGENITISDGDHTFSELYEHRNLLFINLCLSNRNNCYYVPNHFPGWFLLVMNTSEGQISYHCENKMLDLIKEKIKINKNHIWDGHDSKEVITRLTVIAEKGDDNYTL